MISLLIRIYRNSFSTCTRVACVAPCGTMSAPLFASHIVKARFASTNFASLRASRGSPLICRKLLAKTKQDRWCASSNLLIQIETVLREINVSARVAKLTLSHSSINQFSKVQFPLVKIVEMSTIFELLKINKSRGEGRIGFQGKLIKFQLKLSPYSFRVNLALTEPLPSYSRFFTRV